MVMINVLNVGMEDESSCFAQILRNFGYESRIYLSSCQDMNQILSKTEKNDYLVMEGDLSAMAEKDLNQILKQLHKKGVHLILLFSSESWKKIIHFRPFLIVPSKEEIEQTYHVRIRNQNDAMRSIVRMHDHSHGNILMILKDEKKAVFVCSDGREFVSELPYPVKKDDIVAKESLAAGFLAAYLSFSDYVKTYHYALSAFSISAWNSRPAGRTETEDTYQMMKEKKIWTR